MSNHAVTLIYK